MASGHAFGLTLLLGLYACTGRGAVVPGCSVPKGCPRPTAAEYPNPAENPELCSLKPPLPGMSPMLFCDPHRSIQASWRGKEGKLIMTLLHSFTNEYGSQHLGKWGVSMGLAFVRDTAEPLPVFAAELAAKWGLDNSTGALFVIRTGGRPAAVAAGGLTLAKTWPGKSWQAFATDMGGLLRAGRISDAIRFGLEGIANVIGGGTGWTFEMLGDSAVKQTKKESWRNDFQQGALWENTCADERCTELWLDNIRQFSDRFQHYYHEAMVFPAMNILGRRSWPIKVLVLGAGGGGIVTHILMYKTVGRVVMIEIDEEVTKVSSDNFPEVAAGFADPRSEVIHGDAIGFVDNSSADEAGERFDLVIIDFTHEPIDGSWSGGWFHNVRKLLRPGGLVVQNAGSMLEGTKVRDLFQYHAAAFDGAYTVNGLIPDYKSPYIMALSTTSNIDVLDVDWSYWEEQNIVPMYYSPALHQVILTMSADFMVMMGLKIPRTPSRPMPVTAELTPCNQTRAELHEGAFLTTTDYNTIKLVGDGNCGPLITGECKVLQVQGRDHLGYFARYASEAMVLPVMALLGKKAQRVLVLGGGTGAILSVVQQFRAVKKIVVVEIDEQVVMAARTWFSHVNKSFTDPRIHYIGEDAYDYLVHDRQETFDAIWLDLSNHRWQPPGPTSRIPQTFAFVDKLRSLLAPHGLLMQDLGTMAFPRRASAVVDLSRIVFSGGAVFPMAYSTPAHDFVGSPAGGPIEELDGAFSRPPLLALLSSPSPFDPLTVDWATYNQAGIKTVYYHPSLHESLFVLPYELQVKFDAPPPRDFANIHLEDPSKPVAVGTEEQREKAVVYSFVMNAHGCSFESLNGTEVISTMLKDMAVSAGLTLLQEMSHQFLPQGVTALLLVSESHLSIHTWPELGYAALDIVSCKEITPKAMAEVKATVQSALQCIEVPGQLSVRGSEDGGAISSSNNEL